MFQPKLSVSINSIEALGLKDGAYQYALADDYEAKIKEAKALGFYGIELDLTSACYAWKIEELAKPSCEVIKKHGLVLNSVHMPFNYDWTDLTSSWESDRVEIIKWFKKLIGVLDEYSPRAYVFHPSNRCTVSEDNYKEVMDKLISTASEIAKGTKAYVCLENMCGGQLFNTAEKVQDFLSGAKNCYAVTDVNHFLQDKPQAAILSLGNKVKTIHISDYDGVKERHWLPGEGCIDFMAVIDALEKVGYDGVFNYEVLAKYTLKQIKENYDNLFEQYKKYKKA